MTIRQSRRFVLIAMIILILVDVVCIGILLSPLAKSPAQREADLRDMQAQLKDKQLELGPTHGVDKKIDAARENIALFYKDRLPARYSNIDETLSKAGQDAGVQVQNITFKPDKKDVEDLQKIEISLTISGPYVNDVKFINELERDKLFFVIDSVSLAGATNGVQLQVKAETYFKTGAA